MHVTVHFFLMVLVLYQRIRTPLQRGFSLIVFLDFVLFVVAWGCIWWRLEGILDKGVCQMLKKQNLFIETP